MDNKKIIDYGLVSGLNLDDVYQNVIPLLQQGWQPLGNITFYHHTSNVLNEGFVQTMVRYE